ncbi:MAG: tetratricopeptide repeat protein [Elusimicrobiota bacterium]
MHIKTRFLVLVFTLFLNCPVFSKNIAVIPFQNITGDKEKNWIGAGFSETLTTKLVKVSEITVIERENLSKILEEIKFQYTGAVDEKTAVEKGKLYGADVIVFGSFQVIGAQLKITARFVDVQTRKIIDTAEANGNISDIFKLQDEIAFSLLDSLKIVLGEKEKEEVKINPTENLTAYQWFSKGYEADTLKLYDKAIEYYTKAIEINPKFEDAYVNRGVAYGNKGLYDEAIEDCTKAIQMNPKDAGAYVNRGIVYNNKGLYDEAIEDCIKAIQINPKLAEAYFGRGVAYVKKRLYDEAIEYITKAIQMNPKLSELYHPYAYSYRGIAYNKKGLPDEAIEDYTKAIQINPKYAEAYVNRGIAYYGKGLDDEAIADCTKAIQINPKLAEAYVNRGNAYYNKRLNKLCISDWKKAADLGSEKARQGLKEFFNIDY